MPNQSIRRIPLMVAVAALLAAAFASPASATPTGKAEDSIVPGHYIVVLKDSVDHPGAVAETQTAQRDGELGFVYGHALRGYSAADLTKADVEVLRRDPRVKYVVPDRKVEAQAQSIPTGISRIFATENKALDIDEKDDVRIDADVAIIDTGIDYTHPDLAVSKRTNCIPADENPETKQCVDDSGVDGNGHGTHVAGTVAAIDNGIGVVGVAPGARLHAVRVLNNNGEGYDSWIIAGIDWVTKYATTIEVANMSIGGLGPSPAMDEAIAKSVNAGVVYVAAAGNNASIAQSQHPANSPDVITVSALNDHDGKPGGKGSSGCAITTGPDDTPAFFSNWGSAVEIAAPGVCINSTLPVGGSAYGANYGTLSGTSMAAPHVAGAAAVLASTANPGSRKDVEAIRQTLIDDGSLNWNDSIEDTRAEPLLYLGGSPLSGLEVATAGWTSHGSENAVLFGALNPHNVKAEYWFEYGPTTAYGQKAPASPGIASGEYASVSQSVSGLERGQSYHYRLASSTGGGTVYGQDRTFTPSLWSRQIPTSTPQADEEILEAVSCPSATWCMAVGWYYGTGDSRLVSYMPSGGKWTYSTLPLPANGSFPYLYDISCASTSSCIAVGKVQMSTGEVVPLVETWNGSSWSAQTLTPPVSKAKTPHARFTGVSCVSATLCMAVGYFKKEEVGEEPTWTTYSAQLQSGAWTNLTTPASGKVSVEELTAVSCVSASFCAAVGSGYGSLSLIWDGSKWSSHEILAGYRQAISCTSSSFCMTVGIGEDFQLWNGSSWFQYSRKVGAGPLRGVSCVSATQCTAVGYENVSHQVGLAESWDGAAWHPQGTDRDEERHWLKDISCGPDAGCTAVGVAHAAKTGSLIASTPNWRPTATTEGASSIAAGKATLTGKVNPRGISTGYHFEWGTKAEYEKGEYNNRYPAKDASAGSGETDAQVEQTIAGIKSQTEYHYRLVVESQQGKTIGSDKSFVTPDWRPQISSTEAVEVTGSKATLQAMVNPNGFNTVYRFEYGETDKYGAQIPIPDKAIGSGPSDVKIGEELKGLTAGTTYHYRVIAFSEVGVSYGEDKTVTTCKASGCQWSLQTTLNPEPPQASAQLEGVSCPSASMCMATGEDKQGKTAFVNLWNGSAWEAITESWGLDGSRYGIACNSATSCFSVGTTSGGKASAERWVKILGNWNREAHTPANPEGSSEVKLREVSCTSATACTAVGSYVKEGKTKTLAERWNGSSWSIQTTPNPEAGNAELLGVSCDATTCTAVGKQGASPYAMRWNGTSWSTMSIPTPGGATESSLEKVSCPSGSFCMAVGFYKEGSSPAKTLTERWNGSSWSVQASPNQAGTGGSYLHGVSCPSASVCTAVGHYSPALLTEAKTLVESWNGSEWTIQSSPNPEGKKVARLAGVSCISASACTAVGRADTVTLGERWNGTSWSLQTTLNPEPPQASAQLEGVSCPSASMCMATGEDKQGKTAFVNLWNGSAWEAITESWGLDGSRYGIACNSATSCFSVGTTSGGKASAERWVKILGNWNREAHTPANPEGSSEVKLREVSCTSATACTAVGSYVKEGKTKTLAERWNGSSWSIQTTPNPEAGNAELLGVSCDATTCTAVGKQGASPYAMRWNGTSWSTMSIPTPGGATESSLEKVSCPSGSFCMAVGFYKEGSSPAKTLTERWNGSSWSVQASPNQAGTGGSYLHGVSCPSASVCTAVGHYSPALLTEAKTLVESWNGSEWTIQSSPNPEGKKVARLAGVSCISASACTAVGRADTVTLGERYE